MSFDEMYAILGTRDTSYNAIFITAVQTTGIFCLPSCRARTPLAKNVRFYQSTSEAIQNGFRPCKVCKPLEQNGNIPDHIENLIKEIQDKPNNKITDDHLVARGIKPHTLRRWFKKNHGITFHEYQRSLRMGNAALDIKNGKSITHTADENGDDSIRGFRDGYRVVFGVSPSKSVEKRRVTTPLGILIACASEQGLCYLGYDKQLRIDAQLAEIAKELDAAILPGSNEHLTQAASELSEYFDGSRKEFSVSLHMVGTEFRKKVWVSLLDIPYAKTVSYKEQSISVGNLKAIRAVASSNGANKISIIIPCHRVIGSDGSLTGYASGLHRKKWLLDFERRHSDQSYQQELAF